MYFQLIFALERVKVLVPQHLKWKEKEPLASFVRGDVKGVLAGGEKAIAEIVMATQAGMTTEEFEKIVNDWDCKASSYQAAVYRDSLSTNARTAGVSAAQLI
jgi:hypothetical protein